MSTLDPNMKFDLSKASALIVDGSQHSLDMTSQMLKGFGLGNIHRSGSVEDAEKHSRFKAVDLILVDPSIESGTGYEFVIALRRSAGPSAFAPVILICGHVRTSDVSRARNTGANFVVTKPLSPSILLQRILWIARDKRPFVEVGQYIGPDRRFKFEGPPAGSDGRRHSDLSAPLSDAGEPNMSQDEVDAFIKPQRVMI